MRSSVCQGDSRTKRHLSANTPVSHSADIGKGCFSPETARVLTRNTESQFNFLRTFKNKKTNKKLKKLETMSLLRDNVH
uniref:Uncharacterized protein n=1 Tax=Anguilla anguilla TaxID=7936 RepID=A0A0E9RIC2_ANGAN